MAMPPRLQPVCPPSAHKVIRPPETQILARLCVTVNDSELANGALEICMLLKAFADRPLVLCSERVRTELQQAALRAEVEPVFVRVSGPGRACAATADTSEKPLQDCVFYDDASSGNYQDYLSQLKEDCIITLDMPSMYILRSVATVYAWDGLLAKQFLGQYFKVLGQLKAADWQLLQDVRYGREDSLKLKEKSASAYAFSRLERKLFLQYPPPPEESQASSGGEN